MFDPDVYLCTWNVPALDGGFVALPGSLEVRPNRPPTGTIYGDVPLKWTKNAEGEGVGAGFPQDAEADVLTGTLANGSTVTVTDARLHYWVPGEGTLSGSAAILRRGHIFSRMRTGAQTSDARAPESPLFADCDFQVTALDAVLGARPIKSVNFPHPDATDRSWGATYDKESTLTWDDDSAKLVVGYDGKASAGDAYRFRLQFSPAATVSLSEPASLREIVDDWVQPLRKIVSIATGKPETLTYLAVREHSDAEGASTSLSQVFGTGIDQSPYESSTDIVRNKRSALRCQGDGVSLLSLTKRWQELSQDHHPLIETYGAMLSVADRHPRSRFLMLIQAIEGMYGYEARADREAREADYATARAEFLARVSDLLEPEDQRFLNRRLGKRLPAGLDEALIAVITRLPVDLLDVIASTQVIVEMKTYPGVNTTPEALRLLRNHLAHGEKGYDSDLLTEVVDPLERVVRAHSLRLLGCPDVVLQRVLENDG